MATDWSILKVNLKTFDRYTTAAGTQDSALSDVQVSSVLLMLEQ